MNDSLKWNQETIDAWSRKTFGHSGALKRALRMNIEIAELLSALENTEFENAGEECADVFIVLSQVTAALGKDLMDEVQKKMDINEQRKWKQLPSGRHQHV